MALRFRKDSKKEFEELGYQNLVCDKKIEPPEGFPPVKVKPFPESAWSKDLWPLGPSKPRVCFLTKMLCVHMLIFLDQATIKKGDAKLQFLVGPTQPSQSRVNSNLNFNSCQMRTWRTWFISIPKECCTCPRTFSMHKWNGGPGRSMVVRLV